MFNGIKDRAESGTKPDKVNMSQSGNNDVGVRRPTVAEYRKNASKSNAKTGRIQGQMDGMRKTQGNTKPRHI